MLPHFPDIMVDVYLSTLIHVVIIDLCKSCDGFPRYVMPR